MSDMQKMTDLSIQAFKEIHQVQLAALANFS
jgi:hypothetical protein